jgi:RND superfamily putative drug exporter
MRWLASLVVRRRVVILILGLVGMLVAGALGRGVAGRLSSGGFDDPEAEAVVAAGYLEEHFGVRSPDLVLVATAPPGSVDTPEAVGAGMELTNALAAEPGVASASSYWTLGSPPSLRNGSGDRALVFANLDGDDDLVLDVAARLAATYSGRYQGLEVMVGGTGPLFAEVTETVESDLVRAESIAFPITMVLLVLVFGSVVAASLPLAVGGFAIVGTFLVLDLIARATDVSIFSLNQTTALGLGLGIDYALFVVSRFREELAGGHPAHEAVRRTVLTAGRTVLFSAGTVMASLAAMMVFPLFFLRSFAYSGIAVVALAGVGAVLVLPALLAVLGPWVNRLRVRRLRDTDGAGIWGRIATAVMRRPVLAGGAAVAVLVALGSPFLAVRMGVSDDRVLPSSFASRQVGDILRTEFDAFESSPIQVVAAGLVQLDVVDDYATDLSRIDGIARVDAPSGSYVDGLRVVPAGPAHAGLIGADGSFFNAIPSVDPTSGEAEEVVAEIRAGEAPVAVQVTGRSAFLVDTKAAIFGALPWALGIIGAVTFVVLFLMFGSVLVPAKAVVLNLLSLSATFGSLVWIFQDGHLSSLLDFTATGGLEMTMPILMFAIAFGLSMDYEVFLLSRIKEEHDAGADTVASVATGLERTGRIVTAAALLMSVVFIAFAISDVSFMKMFGIGMTLAVLVDAFVVRTTLVPAFMRLAGKANWWAPRWMKRLYERFGIREHIALDGPLPNLETA